MTTSPLRSRLAELHVAVAQLDGTCSMLERASQLPELVRRSLALSAQLVVEHEELLRRLELIEQNGDVVLRDHVTHASDRV